MSVALNILLAEDNDGDYELLSSHLDGFESTCTLHRVYDGEEVVPFLQAAKEIPDVIILDINMPLMNGHETLKALAATPEYKAIPSLVLTSSLASRDIETARSEGANGYIVKPGNFTYKELHSFVESTKANPDSYIQVGQ